MTRPYRLGRRQELAQETRDKILQAAAGLLAEIGFRGVTMQRVAVAADVSRVTVYDHFKDKAGLLEALAWWTVARLDIDRVRRARLQPDVRAALGDFVRENARFYDAAGVQGRAILRTAFIDPNAVGVLKATYFDARRDSIAELVERLANEGELSPTWPRDRAVHALMVITSLEAFETLTEHGSLTVDAAADLFAKMTEPMLHGDNSEPAHGDPRPR